jgi:type IV secretory pathway VirB10-like protein
MIYYSLLSIYLCLCLCLCLCRVCVALLPTLQQQYPSTYFVLICNAQIGVICQSCGMKTSVERLEMNDKFKRYVKNHPPPPSVDIRPKREGEMTQQQQPPQASDNNDAAAPAAAAPPAAAAAAAAAATTTAAPAAAAATTTSTETPEAEEEDTGMNEPTFDPIMQELANARLNSAEDFESTWSTDASADAAAARARALLPDKLRELVSDQAADGMRATLLSFPFSVSLSCVVVCS